MRLALIYYTVCVLGNPWRVKRVHTGYQICHMNVRSLLRHKDDFEMSLCSNEIMCLSETWLSSKTHDNMLSLCFYNFIRQDRNNQICQPNVKSRGGGIYFKELYTPTYQT